MATKASDVKKQIEEDLNSVQDAVQGKTPVDEEQETEETDSSLWDTFAQELDSDVEEDVILEDDGSKDKVPEDLHPEETPAEEVVEEEVIEEVTETPAAETETVTEPEPPVEQPVEQPQVPQTPPKTAEELRAEQEAEVQRRKELRNKALDQLATSYKLGEGEAEQFLTNPEEIIPKFAARLFFDVFDATVSNIMSNIPALMENYTKTQAVQRKAEDMFYDANPLIDREKYSDMVNQYANVYVQVNPNTTAERMIKDVGVQVMYALGIDPAKAAASQTEVKAKAPSAPAKKPPAKQQPYTPAGAGTQHAPAQQSQGDNIWGNIADQLAEDDF